MRRAHNLNGKNKADVAAAGAGFREVGMYEKQRKTASAMSFHIATGMTGSGFGIGLDWGTSGGLVSLPTMYLHMPEIVKQKPSPTWKH